MKGAGHPLNLFCVQAVFKIICDRTHKKGYRFCPLRKVAIPSNYYIGFWLLLK